MGRLAINESSMSRASFPRNHKWGKSTGATILEVLIVLGIITLIASVAAPRVIGYLGRAQTETARLQIQNLTTAVQLFYIDMGRYPTEAEGLAILIQPPPNTDAWNGPYINAAEGLSDPWGRDYLFETAENVNGFSIRSLGRDGHEGGDGEDTDLSS
ncbi:type II secretion system major pseudopilin GspG [Fontisubflavum oceani]|uniref:type II secretion system major pseudopilin GspG n=1 Tax=Fontisubflavum oceani TaxID=2978973 RepID=UPI0038B25378